MEAALRRPGQFKSSFSRFSQRGHRDPCLVTQNPNPKSHSLRRSLQEQGTRPETRGTLHMPGSATRREGRRERPSCRRQAKACNGGAAVALVVSVGRYQHQFELSRQFTNHRMVVPLHQLNFREGRMLLASNLSCLLQKLRQAHTTSSAGDGWGSNHWLQQERNAASYLSKDRRNTLPCCSSAVFKLQVHLTGQKCWQMHELPKTWTASSGMRLGV